MRSWEKKPVHSPWEKQDHSLIESIDSATPGKPCVQNDINVFQ